MADYQGGFRRVHFSPEGIDVLPGTDDSGTWRIRIDEAFRENDLAVTVIAAHELAHFVLFREGLDGHDEQLVDVALVLLGYGPLMRRLRTTSQRCRTPDGKVAWTVCGPTYLHPAAIEYVEKRRHTLQAS
jgi:hypothetical protein